MNKRITDDEFDTAQQEVDRRIRAVTRADDRTAFNVFHAQWEALVKACDARRADDRERADIAIRTFAIQHGLIQDVPAAPAEDPELLLAGMPSGDAAAIRALVERGIASKTWRSVVAKDARSYASGSSRLKVEQYIHARYDAAGAGFSGRWQG